MTIKAGDEVTVVTDAGGNIGAQGVVRDFSGDWVQIKFHHKIGVKGNLVKTNYISWVPLSIIQPTKEQ